MLVKHAVDVEGPVRVSVALSLKQSLTLKINGVSTRVQIAPWTSLLDLLRDRHQRTLHRHASFRHVCLT